MIHERRIEFDRNIVDLTKDRRADRARDEHFQRRNDQKKKAALEERENDSAGEVQGLIQAITEEPLGDLTQQFAEFDAVLIERIMANEKRLAKLREELNAMKENAVRLADGRYAFDDGQGGLVDESGKPLAPEDLIDAEFPDNGKPLTSHDSYMAAKDEHDEVDAERKTLIVLQRRSDKVQKQLADGAITEAEAEEALAELERQEGALTSQTPAAPLEAIQADNALLANASPPPFG